MQSGRTTTHGFIAPEPISQSRRWSMASPNALRFSIIGPDPLKPASRYSEG